MVAGINPAKPYRLFKIVFRIYYREPKGCSSSMFSIFMRSSASGCFSINPASENDYSKNQCLGLSRASGCSSLMFSVLACSSANGCFSINPAKWKMIIQKSCLGLIIESQRLNSSSMVFNFHAFQCQWLLQLDVFGSHVFQCQWLLVLIQQSEKWSKKSVFRIYYREPVLSDVLSSRSSASGCLSVFQYSENDYSKISV
jgi:hypothetical protein